MKNQLRNTHMEAHHSTKMLKVMVMFIFFSVFLVGTVSAVEWNDKLIYSENDLKVSLDNWWGLGKTIGTAKLESHKSVDEVRGVKLGESVVMWYNLNFFELYSEGLGDVEIINVNTGEIIQRNYTFVYWGNETYQIPNYVCGNILDKNGTIGNVCNESGTKDKTREAWLPYNSRDIPKGKITLGVEINMLMDETLDIIWKIGGKKIKKHAVVSSGAVETIDGDFTVLTYNNNGTFNTTTDLNMEILVVGGGGGGGAGSGGAGGGGGGGLIFNSSFSVLAGDFNVVVGLGGIGSSSDGVAGGKGQNSSFSTQTAEGGGGGGTNTVGVDGGSGGGGGSVGASHAGGTGNQGFDGGSGTGSSDFGGGGGGGSNETGFAGSTTVGGNGGDGGQFNINGTNTAYAGGGGGGISGSPGSGGDGGGGGGGSSGAGNDGTVNTGGGGGGGDDGIAKGGDGGSGIVIIRYLTADAIPIPTINLDSPENNTNFTLTNQVVMNATIFDDTNITNVTLYLNDVGNETNSTSGLNNTVWTFTKNMGEGDTFFTFEACNFNNICTNASEGQRTFNVNTTPFINYTDPTPINEFNTTNDFFEVNVTITEDLFQNITFDLYNVLGGLNQTVTFTNSSRLQNWTNLITAKYSYNATIATTTNQFNSTATRNISLDSTSPSINITFPTETITFHAINTNIFVNWTVSDINLDTCILEYEGSNTTLTCLDNSTSINITTILNRTITFYANDTFGNVNSSSRSWNYTIFQNSLTFNSETIGGSTEEFTLNITKDSSLQISTVDLIYNLSSSSSSFTSGDTSIITSSLDVPNPPVDTNLSFFHSFTMSDAQIINTTSNNQTVLNFGIGNCSTFTTLIFNFTMLDEENQTQLTNTTIDYAFNLFDTSRLTLITNFSEASTVNPTAVCINQNLTTSSFSLDAVLQYVSTNASYLTRYHNILNFTLSNSTIPNDIDLFDVLDTTATPFQLTFRDSLLVLAPNILVNVNKQFVASNDFKTVEIPITDTNGQAILNLVRNTAIYNLIFVDIGGNIVATFNQISAFCQDSTIGDCTLELDSASTVPETFNLSESNKISFTIAYTNSTSTATLNFNSINSTAVTVRLLGTTQNQFGNRSVCDNSLTSTLGTINCDTSGILTSDNFLFLDVFSDGIYISTTVINVNPSNPLVGGFYGSDGYFIAFMMLLLIILLFSDDRQALLIMLGMGWVAILIFGLVKGTIIGAVSGGIWLLVSIAIFIWKLKQEEVGV